MKRFVQIRDQREPSERFLQETLCGATKTGNPLLKLRSGFAEFGTWAIVKSFRFSMAKIGTDDAGHSV
jgi:hypothetical protein